MLSGVVCVRRRTRARASLYLQCFCFQLVALLAVYVAAHEDLPLGVLGYTWLHSLPLPTDACPACALQGFNILAGGGMGRTHRNKDTFPRLADPIGYVDKDDIFHVVKAIVATQRDYGRRDDRRQARLKYLVDEWGVDKFRAVVEQYFGKKIKPFV